MSLILMLIGLASLGLSFYLVIRVADLQSQLRKALDDNADNLSEQVSYQLDLAKKDQILALNQELGQQKTETYQQLADIRDVLHKNLSDNRDRSDQRLELMNQTLTKAV